MNIFRSSIIFVLSEGISMVLLACTMHLYGRHLGSDMLLADYQRLLAGIGIMSPLLGLGSYGSILYYIGKAPRDIIASAKIFFTSLAVVCLIGAAFIAIVLGLSPILSQAYFRRPGTSMLLISTSLLLMAKVIGAMSIHYCWARNMSVKGAVLLVTIWGLIPFMVILVACPKELSWLVGETAICTAIVVGAFIWRQAAAISVPLRSCFDATIAKKILQYGVPRIPAVLGITVVYSMPVILAGWLGCRPSEVVAIGGSMAMLRMLTVAGRGVTYLALPRISRAADINRDVLRQKIRKLAWLSLAAGLLGTMGLVFAGDWILRLWLHRPELDTRGITVFLWISAAPLVMVVVTRPIIDGLSTRAYITRNVLAALLVGVITSAVMIRSGQRGTAMVLGTAISVAELGILNFLTVRKLLAETKPKSIAHS